MFEVQGHMALDPTFLSSLFFSLQGGLTNEVGTEYSKGHSCWFFLLFYFLLFFLSLTVTFVEQAVHHFTNLLIG